MEIARERANKASFVENELSEMLIPATLGFVRKREYVVRHGEELVEVSVDGNSGGPKRFTVNVATDSLWEIAKDVMYAVAWRYQ